MKQNRWDNDLHRAVHLVMEGERRIEKQRELIAKFQLKSQSTTKARAALTTLGSSHREMCNHLDVVQELRELPK